MRYVKRLFLISLLVHGTCSVHNSWYTGKPRNGDIPIFKQNHVLYGLPFLIRTSFLKYPDDPSLELFVITSIYAKDNDHSGNGAHASIISGGLGYTKVEIKFKSKRGHGIDYTVIIFGRWLYLKGSDEELHIVNKLRLPQTRIETTEKRYEDEEFTARPVYRTRPAKQFKLAYQAEKSNWTNYRDFREPFDTYRD